MRYFLTTALLMSIACAALSAQSTFTVTSTADTTANGTLRWAITQANASTSTADTIDFGVTGTITLDTALPAISDDVTIDGPGRTALTIMRNGAAGDFRIFETTINGTTLNINELTISGGRATQGAGIFSRGPTNLWDVRIADCIANGSTGGGIAEGGAIYHSPIVAALTLTNSIIENCQANGGDNASANGGGGYGGAIYINAGTLGMLSTTINNCDASGGDSTGANGAGGDAVGGAVFSQFAATFTDCVVSNCDAVGGAPNGTGAAGTCSGGGIWGEGAITSIDTTWQNNTVSSVGEAAGGAIRFEPSATQQLTITRSIFTGNDATAGGTNQNALGAAVSSFGVVEIRETEFSSNVATSTGTGIDVVIYHESSSAFLMERTTIAGNTGEGVHIEISSSADIVNSTISGNTASVNAGGVTTLGAAVDVTFSTVTLNSGGTGGGIATAGSGTITVTGSIIAENTGGSAADADYALSGGSIFDAGGNVIGVEDGSTFTNGGTQTGTSTTPLDPLLGLLADNGGLTRTHALQMSSPAMDMGGATAVPATDQRNAPRNVGPADAGAYEFGATVPSGQGTAGGEGDERCSTDDSSGLSLILLAGLLALVTLGIRLRRA